MAHIWNNVNNDAWAPTELRSAAVLGGGSVEFVGNIRRAARRGKVLLYPVAAGTQAAQWALLAPAGAHVCINDAPVENGIRVLADRDAIRVANLSPMYFSTERLARVEPFPNEENVFCPRCKSLIAPGEPAVSCPQCGISHHESSVDGEGCWTYAETCALCDQSTDLDSAGFRWTPEEL
jgi:hypothetical protein